MTTLKEAIANQLTKAGGASSSVRKHLAAVGINAWEDLTRERLYDYRDHLIASVSANTAGTVLSRTCGMLARYQDEIELPDDWRKILSVKRDKPMRTYLTPDELAQLAAVRTNSTAEEVVRCECLLEARTGARISDIMEFTPENVDVDVLSYVSRKTKVRASVPVSPATKAMIAFVQENRAASPKYTKTRCDIIIRLCERAGIDEPVTVYEGGKTRKGPKYLFVTSHTFRISFVTNLHKAGLDLLTISRMAGHTNVAMTERYCAYIEPKIQTAEAAGYLGL